MLVLAVNDHLLKGSGLVPGWLTGKLSDVAGLLFFPLLLAAIAEEGARLVSPLGHRGQLVVRWAALAVTGAVFTAVKLHPGTNALVAALWGPMALDPTDLLALPVLIASAAGFGRVARPDPRWRRLGIIAVAAIASAATSPVRGRSYRYAVWSAVDDAPQRAGCAAVQAWVAKSGKTGVGLTVRLHAADVCRVRIGEAVLEAGATRVAAAALPAAAALGAGQESHLYLPFVFDVDRAWNQGVREGRVLLRGDAGGRFEVVLRLVQRAEEFHVVDGDP